MALLSIQVSLSMLTVAKIKFPLENIYQIKHLCASLLFFFFKINQIFQRVILSWTQMKGMATAVKLFPVMKVSWPHHGNTARNYPLSGEHNSPLCLLQAQFWFRVELLQLLKVSMFVFLTLWTLNTSLYKLRV